MSGIIHLRRVAAFGALLIGLAACKQTGPIEQQTPSTET